MSGINSFDDDAITTEYCAACAGTGESFEPGRPCPACAGHGGFTALEDDWFDRWVDYQLDRFEEQNS